MDTSLITVIITLFSTSGVLTLFLCAYAFLRRKEIEGGYIFVMYTAVLVVYIFSAAFELTSESLESVKRLVVLEYVGIGFAPPLSLLVVLQYIGKLPPRRFIPLLFVIPATTLVMVATNDMHHLFYKDIHFRENAPLPLVDVSIGQWYIVQGCFTFGSMLAALVLLLSRWRQTNAAFRPQLATLIVGQILPIVTAFLYLVGLTPYGMDIVPMVLCVTSALYIWAMVRSHLLTIVPIAKESIFNSMKEGVIVLDAAERVVDFNPAVTRMIPGLSAVSIGRPLGEVWPRLTGAVLSSTGPSASSGHSAAETNLEMNWTVKGAEATYQVRSSPVLGRAGVPVGRLLMLIDVTEQKRLQDRLTQQAYFDGLTKLLNRTRFVQRARDLIVNAQRFELDVSIILFDLDRFKSVNDTYGHDAGDRAIVHTVETVNRLLPPDTLFARYGGEEFVIALPGTPLEDAAALAERLRAALQASPLAIGAGGIGDAGIGAVDGGVGDPAAGGSAADAGGSAADAGDGVAAAGGSAADAGDGAVGAGNGAIHAGNDAIAQDAAEAQMEAATPATIVVTASFGVASARAGGAGSAGSLRSIEELLHEADAALYKAKQDGRNAVRTPSRIRS